MDNLQHTPSSLTFPMTSYLPVACKGNTIHSVAPAVVPTPIPTLYFGFFTSNGCVPEWFGTRNPDLIKNLAKNLAGTLAELNYTFFTSISVNFCPGRFLNHLLPTLGHPRRSLQHINLRGSIGCIQAYKKIQRALSCNLTLDSHQVLSLMVCMDMILPHPANHFNTSHMVPPTRCTHLYILLILKGKNNLDFSASNNW